MNPLKTAGILFLKSRNLVEGWDQDCYNQIDAGMKIIKKLEDILIQGNNYIPDELNYDANKLRSRLEYYQNNSV